MQSKDDPLAEIRHILEEVASERTTTPQAREIHVHLHGTIVLAPELLRLVLDALKTVT